MAESVPAPYNAAMGPSLHDLDVTTLEGLTAPAVRAFRTVFLHGSGVVLILDLGEPAHRAYYMPTAVAHRLAREVVTFSKRLGWQAVPHRQPLTAAAADMDVSRNLRRVATTRLARLNQGTFLGIEGVRGDVAFHRWPDEYACMALREIRDAFDRGWFPITPPPDPAQAPSWSHAAGKRGGSSAAKED